MSNSPDRSPRALAALAAALGITIGVAPQSLLAQGTTKNPGAPPTQVAEKEGTGAKAVQQKGGPAKDARLHAAQVKGVQPAGAHPAAAQLKIAATQIKIGADQNKGMAASGKPAATQLKVARDAPLHPNATQQKTAQPAAVQQKADAKAATPAPKHE